MDFYLLFYILISMKIKYNLFYKKYISITNLILNYEVFQINKANNCTDLL